MLDVKLACIRKFGSLLIPLLYLVIVFLNLLIKDPTFDKNTALPKDIFGQFGDNIIRLSLEYIGVLFYLLYITDQPKNEEELNGPTSGPFLQELIVAKPYQRNR